MIFIFSKYSIFSGTLDTYLFLPNCKKLFSFFQKKKFKKKLKKKLKKLKKKLKKIKKNYAKRINLIFC